MWNEFIKNNSKITFVANYTFKNTLKIYLESWWDIEL